MAANHVVANLFSFSSPGVGIVRFPDTGIQQRDLMDDFYIIAQQVSVPLT